MRLPASLKHIMNRKQRILKENKMKRGQCTSEYVMVLLKATMLLEFLLSITKNLSGAMTNNVALTHAC